MNPLRTLFSLLIFSLLISSCSAVTAQGTGKIQETGTPGTATANRKFEPLGSLEESLLFKGAVTVFGDYYSGLILIKQVPRDSAIHVMFLSELGLNLMELVYRNDEFKVENVREFLNRPSILKTLQNDFRTLLLDLSKIKKFSIKSEDNGDTEVLKFRHKSQRYSYNCHENLGPTHIRRRKGICRRVDFRIEGGGAAENEVSKSLKINIKHRGIRLKMDLTELQKLQEDGD